MHYVIQIGLATPVKSSLNMLSMHLNRTGPGAQRNPPAIAATWWVTRGSLKYPKMDGLQWKILLKQMII